MKKLKLALVLLIGTTSVTIAQGSSLVAAESKLVVNGTSNLHDWDVTSKTMSGKGTFEITNNDLKDISALTFVVEAESLKSGKNGMDKNTYKALKTDKYKNITYKLIKVIKITEETGSFKVDVQGDLTVAGTTKRVSFPITAKVSGKKVVLSGKISLDMTNYGIEPPKALMGTIKTGKTVTVDFKASYN